jgi:hypothetical protein
MEKTTALAVHRAAARAGPDDPPYMKRKGKAHE